jgi:hypothetical protein
MVLVLALQAWGCGYALAGRGNALPDTIRVIGVPDFQNRSQYPDIDRYLTESVREEFQSRGRYRILSQSEGVDGVFVGTLVSVEFRPATFTTDNQVARNMMIVTAAVEFKEVATGKVIWANPSYQLREEYQLEGVVADPAANLLRDRDAQLRIARSFARSVVTSVFEAF